jgi:signal peptidase I
MQTRFRLRKNQWILIPFAAAAFWLAVSTIAYATSVRIFKIPTASMSPTLAPGDRICVDTRRLHRPERGELWAFTMPGGVTIVKRAVGLPGETIEVAGGRLLINGRPLPEPYIAAPMAYTLSPITLEADQYFMLGDNRNASNDSHLWGPLNGRSLLGRVDYRCWPAGRIAGLR